MITVLECFCFVWPNILCDFVCIYRQFESANTAQVFFNFQAFYAVTLDFVTLMGVTLWVIRKMDPILKQNPELQRLSVKHANRRSKKATFYQRLKTGFAEDTGTSQHGLQQALEIVQFSPATTPSSKNTENKEKSKQSALNNNKDAIGFVNQDDVNQDDDDDNDSTFAGPKARLKSVGDTLSNLTSSLTSKLNSPFKPHRSNASDLNDEENKPITIAMVLHHSEAFELFMQHLCREFSSETLLSLVEFNQFILFVINDIDSDDEKDESGADDVENEFGIDQDMNINSVRSRMKRNKFLKFEFGDSVPKSSIVFDTKCFDKQGNEKHGLSLYKEIGYQLFGKYIQTGSEFEINISSILRNHFSSLMGNYDKWMAENDNINGNSNSNSSDGNQVDIFELLSLFDECNKTNVRLMRGALNRFQKTGEFYRLTKFMFFQQH